MIRYIDALVAAPKIPEKLKHFVLDEFNGQIVGGHSITLTGRRCLLADTKHDVEQTAAVTVIADFMHQLKGNDDSMRERLLLHRAIKQARQNGWNGGDTILDTIGDG